MEQKSVTRPMEVACKISVSYLREKNHELYIFTCSCKNTLMGTLCDQCEDGYFNYSFDGCSKCGCDPVGSASSTCNNITGQCQCKVN